MSVDDNGDMSITLNESLHHVGLGLKARLPDGVMPSWFAEMDYNRDGLISPAEFDVDLNEELVREVARQEENDD